MYWWLWLIVGVIWLWLSGSTLFGWRRRRIGGFSTFCAVGLWTCLAAVAILFIAPYWYPIYCVFIQPGYAAG